MLRMSAEELALALSASLLVSLLSLFADRMKPTRWWPLHDLVLDAVSNVDATRKVECAPAEKNCATSCG